MAQAPPLKRPQSPVSSYRDTVSRLTTRYPNLNYLNFWLQNSDQLPCIPTAAAVLEFRQDSVRPYYFKDIPNGMDRFDSLRHYLSNTHRSSCTHRLYLLEDLHPRFIEILGSALNIDGTIFASQIRDSHYSDGYANGQVVNLPSFQGGEGWSLKYYETRYFHDETISDYTANLYTADNVKRQITFPRRSPPKKVGKAKVKMAGHLGYVRRKSSFWGRDDGHGGWNGVMLLDAPIQGESRFVIDTNEGERKKKCKSEPYLKGHRDFTPWAEATALLSQGANQPAFQKTSLIEDIIFYWTTASTERINKVLQEPSLVACYQKHIVAAIWFNTLEHLYTLLSRLEIDLWAIEPMVAPHLSSKQKYDYMAYFTQALNEVNTIRRRLNWYVVEMENNLYAMGIDPTETAQTDDDKNFLALYRRLGMYRDWSKTVMEVITSHVNLMETEKSISDSKYLGRLTVLGFIFVPMSFVATFFSMAGDYGVGQGKFWVFFAVAFPLLALILATAFGRWCWIKFELWRKQKRERETRSRRRHTSNRNKDNKQNEELLLGT